MTDDKHAMIYGSFTDNEKRKKKKKIIISIMWSAFSFVFGFLFTGTEAPFGTYPFGIALTSSLTEGAVFSMLGALMRYVLLPDETGVFFICCATTALVCVTRYIFCFLFGGKDGKFGILRLTDALFPRILISTAAALISAFFIFASDSGHLSAVLGGVFSAMLSGALTFIFTSLFDTRYRSEQTTDIGLTALLLVIALSLKTVTVFSFSASLAFAFGATLFCGYRGGAAKGCAAGFLFGFISETALIPPFALAGLCAGMFFAVNPVAAAASSLVGAMCCGIYTGGMEGTLAFLPESIIGAAVITLPAILKILPGIKKNEAGAPLTLCKDIIEKKKESDSKMRLELLSKTTASLSQIFGNLSEKLRKPSEKSLSEACKSVFSEECNGCGIDCPCKDTEELSESDIFGRLCKKIMTSGKITPSRIGELTKGKCPKTEEIIEKINERTAHMTEYALKFDKTGIFAFDYEAMSKLLASALSLSGTGYTIDRILSERMRKAFLRAGIPAENTVVCGDRKKYIVATGSRLADMTLGNREVRELCETVCKTRFLAPEFVMERGCTAMTLEGAKSFSAECVVKQKEKNGENVNGDAVSSVETKDGYLYSFICDGMGSGEDASVTAHICRVFLEKMLICGNDKSNVLSMLNMFLRNKGSECFATVDLLEIDLHMGTASFLKSGAAPSYIIRGGSLFRVASGTFPIGILPEVSAELTEFELRDGDVIILASDGISGDFEVEDESNPSWFSEFLTSSWTDDLNEMAERITEAASDEKRRPDDMTVALIRISDAVKSGMGYVCGGKKRAKARKEEKTEEFEG